MLLIWFLGFSILANYVFVYTVYLDMVNIYKVHHTATAEIYLAILLTLSPLVATFVVC